MVNVPSAWTGPSLSIQVRAVGLADDALADTFRAFLLQNDGSYERIGEIPATDVGGNARSFEKWRVRRFEPLAMTITTWESGGDSVLVVNVGLQPLTKYGTAVPHELVKLFVSACRAVHAAVPIRAAIIGEEAFVASALLDDLWEERADTLDGAPGTLWPVEDGELRWFPAPPISLADV